MWTVIYDDPKRKRGASHTLHRDGCADIERSRDNGGNPRALTATDLGEALIEAQYGGLESHDGSDLGAVDLAPCAQK